MRGLLKRWYANPKFQGLAGSIDGIIDGRLAGWVFHVAGRRVPMSLWHNRLRIGERLADDPRPDLVKLGKGDGLHGFSFPVPPELSFREGDLIEVIDDEAPERRITLKLTRRAFNNCLGEVQALSPAMAAGWAYLPWQPRRACTVEVVVGGQRHASGTADHPHEFLPWGAGRYGFRIPLQLAGSSVTVKDVRVRCVESGRDLPVTFQDWTAQSPFLAAGDPFAAAPGSDASGPERNRELLNRMDMLVSLYRDEVERELSRLAGRIATLEHKLGLSARDSAPNPPAR